MYCLTGWKHLGIKQGESMKITLLIRPPIGSDFEIEIVDDYLDELVEKWRVNNLDYEILRSWASDNPNTH